MCGQAEGGRGTAGEGVLLGVEELLGGRVGLEAEEKRQFGKDLEHEVNLRVFLDFVCATCAPPNAERLVLLAREVWLAFVPYQQSHFDITDLLELAEQIADGALESSPGLLPISHPVPRENSLKLRKFIEIYCATVILVITEYFQNPYFVEEGGEAKRPLVFDFSDSEESEVSFSSPLVKKRKMSVLFLNK